jgi:mevalonate kinase
VFPLLDKRLNFTYEASLSPLEISLTGESQKEAELILPGLFDKALSIVGKVRSDLKGKLNIKSSLPLGTGLGASAAYCVGVARLMVLNSWLKESDIYEFSRGLENIFHGESSGVDIAAALSAGPILFERGGIVKKLELSWKPSWYLSYSGQRGITSECVNLVKSFWSKDEEQAKRVDAQMKQASMKALSALISNDKNSGFKRLCEAIDMAAQCFKTWGLSEGFVAEHIEMLKAHGAVSAKPTGSGGGGFVLSLWQTEPPPSVQKLLIAV